MSREKLYHWNRAVIRVFRPLTPEHQYQRARFLGVLEPHETSVEKFTPASEEEQRSWFAWSCHKRHNLHLMLKAQGGLYAYRREIYLRRQQEQRLATGLPRVGRKASEERTALREQRNRETAR